MLLYARKIGLDADTFVGCVQDRDATTLYTLFQREISQNFLESLIEKETGNKQSTSEPGDIKRCALQCNDGGRRQRGRARRTFKGGSSIQRAGPRYR